MDVGVEPVKEPELGSCKSGVVGVDGGGDYVRARRKGGF